ncbi:MAG: thiamine phosphate synthase, partial [Faecalibacterium prausnitzii]|nr:thiamine phosphate synthase [Faecalibacterium prausnitzii]
MKCDKHTMLLYAVTDRAWVGEQTLYQQVESALKGGATCVQLREKQLGDADFLQEAIQIHALCQQYGVPLFINDNVEVALQCHAEGIHVGQDDMAAAQVRQRVGDGVMIGVSAHTVQEALDAVAH